MNDLNNFKENMNVLLSDIKVSEDLKKRTIEKCTRPKNSWIRYSAISSAAVITIAILISGRYILLNDWKNSNIAKTNIKAVPSLSEDNRKKTIELVPTAPVTSENQNIHKEKDEAKDTSSTSKKSIVEKSKNKEIKNNNSINDSAVLINENNSVDKKNIAEADNTTSSNNAITGDNVMSPNNVAPLDNAVSPNNVDSRVATADTADNPINSSIVPSVNTIVSKDNPPSDNQKLLGLCTGSKQIKSTGTDEKSLGFNIVFPQVIPQGYVLEDVAINQPILQKENPYVKIKYTYKDSYFTIIEYSKITNALNYSKVDGIKAEVPSVLLNVDVLKLPEIKGDVGNVKYVLTGNINKDTLLNIGESIK